MACPPSIADLQPPRIDLRENALGILFLLLTVTTVALRLLVTPQLMNMMVSYTTEGGPFYQKLHFATYATTALLLTLLASRPGRPHAFTDDDLTLLRSLLRYAALISVFIVYFALSGRSSAIGFIIETYLAAVLMAIVLLLQNEQTRRIVATAVLCIVLASAFLALIEVVLQRRLSSFAEGEPVFRATGLSSHPLALGGECAIAIGFVPLTRWPLWTKVSAIFLLLLGVVAASARTALVVSVVEIVLLVLFLRWPNFSPGRERMAKLITLLAMLALGAVMVVILLSVGLLSRFTSTVDDNSLARVQIYDVFSYVAWRDIFLGMDSTDLMQVVNEKVGLPHIESAPVFFIMLMGLPMAILFTVVVVGYILRLFKGTAAAARIGASVIIVIDLSNNALGTKSIDILLLTVLIIGLGKATQTSRIPMTSPTRKPLTHRAGRSLPAARSG